MCATRNGVSPTTNYVTVEKSRQSHIVNSCPLTKFDGSLLRLHEADEAAVDLCNCELVFKFLSSELCT